VYEFAVTSNLRARVADDFFDDRVNLEDRRDLREQRGRRKERIDLESSEFPEPESNSTSSSTKTSGTIFASSATTTSGTNFASSATTTSGPSPTDGANQLARYGPLQAFLDDPTIEEIWINSPQRVFIARNGRSELTNLILTSDEIQALMDRILLWSGRRIDLSQPFVDARLPDGSRLHIAIPEITSEHWAINIRKHLMRGKSLKDLVELEVMNDEVAGILMASVLARKNILVSGSTQAGKTTLLNALVSSIPVTERVITIEEVFELRPKLPDCIAMQTRGSNFEGVGEISIRRLIKEALRMRPSRIVIGEIREAESLDLLIALNSGIPGMATLHANSAREAVRKLQTLPLLAGENITQDFLTPTVSRAIDLVVHVGMDQSGKRRIQQLLSVNERSEGGHIDCEEIVTWNGSNYVRGTSNLGRQI
jgi:pilus assembly protein CpaF